MDLPPRVKTQFPNKDNIVEDVITSLPLEYAYFLDDSEQDPYKMNRYYFNFPGNWITSNNGEIIVGIRDIWLVARRRKLEFSLEIVKCTKKIFSKIKNDLKTESIKEIIYELRALKEDQTPKYNIDEDYNVNVIKVIDWLSTEGDLRGLFNSVNESLKSHINHWWTDNKALFNQSDSDILNRDIQTDGYYDDKGFHEIIYSPRNTNMNDNYMVLFRLKTVNDDFRDVFNIGAGPTENNVFGNYEYFEKLVFDNVWDRHSCKVFSSIGEQCNHLYVGNSNVYFDPIKYFKLQSTDQRFWIELYSARNYKVPIKFPKNESFCIEMQFLPFNKTLNL